MRKTLLTSLLGAVFVLTACGKDPMGTASDSNSSPTGASNSNATTDGGTTGNSDSSTGVSASQSGSETDGMTSAGPSTTSPSTSGPSTSGSTGCNFICDPDGGGDLACDNFAQDCPDGQKCAGYDGDGDNAWDSTKCVDVMGNGQHGDPCTAEGGASGIDDCGLGVMCWNLNEEGVGTCVELCTGTMESSQCAPPETKCVIANMGSLNLCLPGCDPTVQDCEPGNVCVSDFMQGFACVLDASGGMAPQGAPCAFANVCNAGLFCANPDFAPHADCQGADGCCSAFCDLTEGNAVCQGIDPQFECVPWFEMGQAPPQYEHVGGCGIPA